MKPRRSRVSPSLILGLLSLMILITLGVLIWLGQPLLEERGIYLPFLPRAQAVVDPLAVTVTSPAFTGTPELSAPTASATASPEPGTPTPTNMPIVLRDPSSAFNTLREQGALVLSMRDGFYTHLFAYHPLYLPLTRLTNTPWDDITPALSPDGTRLAYSSRQNGYWDLYIIDLQTGQQTRLTDTPEYESSPSWSPDGLWIAFDRYNGTSLDIYILALDEAGAQPIQLTDDPGIDRSPAWSPLGREIAFVSSRSGDEEIWLARLDSADNRFSNLSQMPESRDGSPVWSPDGLRLAWAAKSPGGRQIAVWDTQQPDLPARLVGEGDLATFSPDGSLLFSEVRAPNQQGLAVYSTADGRIQQPYFDLPGALYGMTWVKGPLPAWLEEVIQAVDTAPAPILWQPVLTLQPMSPAGRMGLVPLTDVTAPQPVLHDAVDEAFNSLRQEIAAETGWDALSSLENAYVALTTPPTPSIREDWLYTGRAFTLNPLLMTAGWMVVTREDFNGLTYWRLYLKARYQDGSMGMPLDEMVWDINARFAGEPQAYEQGGQFGPVPVGYWIDLTEIAARYGWQRLPSNLNWRTFYPSIRFNLFVMTGGLSWDQAMREIYPVEAMMTSTPPPTFTPTASKTSAEPPRPVTATPTPTLTEVPTRRPTWTPLPVTPAP